MREQRRRDGRDRAAHALADHVARRQARGEQRPASPRRRPARPAAPVKMASATNCTTTTCQFAAAIRAPRFSASFGDGDARHCGGTGPLYHPGFAACALVPRVDRRLPQCARSRRMVCPPAVRRGLLRVAAGTVGLIGLVALAAVPWSRGDAGLDRRTTPGRGSTTTSARASRPSGSVLDAGGRRRRPRRRAGRGRRRRVGRRRAHALRPRRRRCRRRLRRWRRSPSTTPTACRWPGKAGRRRCRRRGSPGGSATFLVPTPLGLRLARLEPMAGVGSGRRRVGVVVAEAALSIGGRPESIGRGGRGRHAAGPGDARAERRGVVRSRRRRSGRARRHDARHGAGRQPRISRPHVRAGGAG